MLKKSVSSQLLSYEQTCIFFWCLKKMNRFFVRCGCGGLRFFFLEFLATKNCQEMTGDDHSKSE